MNDLVHIFTDPYLSTLANSPKAKDIRELNRILEKLKTPEENKLVGITRGKAKQNQKAPD